MLKCAFLKKKTEKNCTDYIQRKKPKRKRHLPAVTFTAVHFTGNPSHPNARVSLRYVESMGVSVFVAGAPLRRNDYVSLYAVKEILTGDQYRARYPKGATNLTEAQLWDKDYIIKYDNDMYMIGDHTEPQNPAGIAQYLNCAMRSSGMKKHCKLVKVTINGQKMYVAKITARSVNVEQLFSHMEEVESYPRIPSS